MTLHSCLFIKSFFIWTSQANQDFFIELEDWAVDTFLLPVRAVHDSWQRALFGACRVNAEREVRLQWEDLPVSSSPVILRQDCVLLVLWRAGRHRLPAGNRLSVAVC